MNHFRDEYKIPSSTGPETCGTTLQCFYFLFYNGLSEGGNMKGFLSAAEPGSWTYPARVFFDSVFFVWVGIVLMNIITGLMVDTFGSIREEKEWRAATLENDCFVCGFSRAAYEDAALAAKVQDIQAPGFDDHLEEDHDLWTYVYFVAHLKRKDPTEDSGIESYVRGHLEANLDWIPNKTCHVFDAEGLRPHAARPSPSAALGD